MREAKTETEIEIDMVRGVTSIGIGVTERQIETYQQEIEERILRAIARMKVDSHQENEAGVGAEAVIVTWPAEEAPRAREDSTIIKEERNIISCLSL